jgi:hypothetical protein
MPIISTDPLTPASPEASLNGASPPSLHPKTLANLRRAEAPLPASTVTMTTPEVGRALRIHPITVGRWARAGVLKSYKFGDTPRAPRRFLAEEIVAFVKSRLVTTE